MEMGDGANAVVALTAWVAAGGLALAGGSFVFGLGAYRRTRKAEARLQHLEAAVAEFCEALQQRLAVAAGRARAVQAACDDTGDEEKG